MMMRSYEADMRFARLRWRILGGDRARGKGRRGRVLSVRSVRAGSLGQLDLRPRVHEPSVVAEGRGRSPRERAEVVVEVLRGVAEFVDDHRGARLIGVHV